MKEMNDILTNKSNFPKGNPFEVPEGYFESLEDRIAAQIEAKENIPSGKQKIIQFVKPMLGLAASFAIAFLLIYYPLGKFIPNLMSTQSTDQAEEYGIEDELILSTNYFDDNSFLQALSIQDNNTEFETEEIMDFLSTELTDYEIYAEIIN